MNLTEALPKEINRVREIQGHFKELRDMPGVLVEPQIKMMENDIQNAITASANGNVVAMLKAYKKLEEYQE